MRAPALILLLLSAASALGGCYKYVPAAGVSLPQAAPLRANLSRPLSFEISDITAHNIQRVDGELVRRDADLLVVSALWLDAATGVGYPGGGWTVTIPADALGELQVRRLDRWRTGALLAAGLAASWIGFDALGGSEGGGGISVPGGQPR